ncbi:MAG: GNAT family N-acetyltransferase [Hyphomicrobiaceae bacterium]|nr:GNAT family N-acetyltransferase [Hyphomicrobiaceae bacterium]
MTGIPTLLTERLRLRPPEIGDFPAFAEMLTSDRSRFMGGPCSKAEAWKWFCHDVAQWHLFGHGALMIERRTDGVCVGEVALSSGPLFPELELGWFLYDGFEGAGYAFEAAATLRDWAFDVLGARTLVSYTDAANRASIALARRLGAVEDRVAPRPDPADLVFRQQPRESTP